ncbi:MAG: hypothetical protein LBN06_00370 [Prevotellaceae bacterium]|jgi:hypothetical protein|nr:hypothetical protein [Prevotellaceae bacterium]
MKNILRFGFILIASAALCSCKQKKEQMEEVDLLSAYLEADRGMYYDNIAGTDALDTADSAIFKFNYRISHVDEGINRKTKLIKDLTDLYNAYQVLNNVYIYKELAIMGYNNSFSIDSTKFEEFYKSMNGSLETAKDKELFHSILKMKEQQGKAISEVSYRILSEEPYLDIPVDTVLNKSIAKAMSEYIRTMCRTLHDAAANGTAGKQDDVYTNLQAMDEAEDAFGKCMKEYADTNHLLIETGEDKFTELLDQHTPPYTGIKTADSLSIAKLQEILDSETYFPHIYFAFLMWRSAVQLVYFSPGNMAHIPHPLYNAMRLRCANTTLKYIEQHPDDALARDAFVCLASTPNLGRRGTYGNQAVEDVYNFFDDATSEEMKDEE